MIRGMAVVGAGYWGPNLVRNFRNSPDWDLVAVCDLDETRARKAIGPRSTVEVDSVAGRLLERDDIEAIAIATPARTHAPSPWRRSKPASTCWSRSRWPKATPTAARMVEAAEDRGLVLMTDHTYCYTPVVQRIARTHRRRHAGRDPLHRLGADQPRADPARRQRLLGPRAARPVDPRLRPARRPASRCRVGAYGADPLRTGKECVGYLTMPLPGGAVAHVHVNWLSPTKIRPWSSAASAGPWSGTTSIRSSGWRMYDRGVDFAADSRRRRQRSQAAISYRLGDMHAPSLPEREALANVATEFAAAISEKRPARTDGRAGLRVLEVLETADRSLSERGAQIGMPSLTAVAGSAI